MEFTKAATAVMNEQNKSTQVDALAVVDDDCSFAELLDQYLPGSLKPGQLVEGQILRISPEGITIDIGAKLDAIVPKQEASKLSEAFLARLTQGGTAPVVVTHTPNGNDELEVSLQRGLEETEWQQAEALLRTGASVCAVAKKGRATADAQSAQRIPEKLLGVLHVVAV